MEKAYFKVLCVMVLILSLFGSESNNIGVDGANISQPCKTDADCLAPPGACACNVEIRQCFCPPPKQEQNPDILIQTSKGVQEGN
ncbi:unnamed protein product [Linum trigynum]|uniref:Uncharacterized protein n=1 Tax=Linum trigynum TaxID=586398 RepID=A0AAV2GT73_9ROSI